MEKIKRYRPDYGGYMNDAGTGRVEVMSDFICDGDDVTTLNRKDGQDG
jgi:hypothetical protein